MSAPQPAAGEALSEDDTVSIDEIIASFDGDLRAAIVALVAENVHLARELDRTRAVVSFGFTRGWHRRRRAGE